MSISEVVCREVRIALVHAATLLVAIGLTFLSRPICQAVLGDGWPYLLLWAPIGLVLGWCSAEIADRLADRWVR